MLLTVLQGYIVECISSDIVIGICIHSCTVSYVSGFQFTCSPFYIVNNTIQPIRREFRNRNSGNTLGSAGILKTRSVPTFSDERPPKTRITNIKSLAKEVGISLNSVPLLALSHIERMESREFSAVSEISLTLKIIKGGERNPYCRRTTSYTSC